MQATMQAKATNEAITEATNEEDSKRYINQMKRAVRRSAIVQTEQEAIEFGTLLRLTLAKEAEAKTPKLNINDEQSRPKLRAERRSSFSMKQMTDEPESTEESLARRAKAAIDFEDRSNRLSKNKKRVTFDNVHIRHYQRIASDHPCVTSGVGIGIGWKFAPEFTVSLLIFEVLRGPLRRQSQDLLLSRRDRRNILIQFKVPLADIDLSMRESARIQHRREASINSGTYFRVEAKLQGMTRSLKRSMGFRSFKSSRSFRISKEDEYNSSVDTFSSDNDSSDLSLNLYLESEPLPGGRRAMMLSSRS
jgi:hypothetical protein